MSRARASQVMVVAEDRRIQRFVVHALRIIGYKPHEIRLGALPLGSGSGEKWVRERYPMQLTTFRRRAARAQTALVLGMDADVLTTESRLKQLEQKLRDQNIDERANSESVALLVTRRNIETWILCLTGTTVNERDDYKGCADFDALILRAASTFVEWARRRPDSMPESCLPSILAATMEIRRIPPMNT